MDIYREVILDHYQNPRHHGALEHADATYEDSNPLCGDRIRMQIKVAENGAIEAVAFDGQGCAISQASASMLSEEIIGKNIDEITRMGRQDVLDNLGIELTPIRLKCALLGLGVLKAAVYQYKGEKPTPEDEE